MKKIISMVLSLSLLFSLSTTVFAAETVQQNTTRVHKQGIVLSETDKYNIQQLGSVGLDSDLIEKLLTVANHITFSDDQKALEIDLSDETLSKEYGFTEQQLIDFGAILNGTYQPPNVDAGFYKNYSVTRAARFYLSNTDLQAGTFAILATAAQISPAALMAAWTSISTALAGPLGTVAGFTTAVLGSAFFADLALKITGALVQGKGVAFYLDWGIPPVTTVIE